MTPCLAPDEFVDLLDDALPPERRAHLDACEQCRATADEMREAWQAAVAVDVPEPSALFWPAVNVRVRAAISGAEAAPGRGWGRWPLLVPAAVAIAAVVAALVTALPRPRPDTTETATAQVAVPSPAPDAMPAGAEPVIAPIDDASLSLMVDLAGELPNGGWDALGVTVLPELDVAAAVLSDDEQRALAALLQAEVSRPKS